MFCPPPAVQKVQLDRRKVRAGVSSVSILVVEDFPQFRQFICSTLRERNDLQIVGEAAEGLEAVQKAVEMKPDLILMDIGLPSLNGLEAARRILQLVPESKIIFLSQESSGEAMQAALNLGAWGYVVKVKAGSGLMPAVDAVILGKKLVSGPTANDGFTH
jgi:DNA-binding NarL/FixJ family response regulator